MKPIRKYDFKKQITLKRNIDFDLQKLYAYELRLYELIKGCSRSISQVIMTVPIIGINTITNLFNELIQIPYKCFTQNVLGK